jgi:hypothetical protein
MLWNDLNIETRTNETKIETRDEKETRRQLRTRFSDGSCQAARNGKKKSGENERIILLAGDEAIEHVTDRLKHPEAAFQDILSNDKPFGSHRYLGSDSP